jgi:hypothetical protein
MARKKKRFSVLGCKFTSSPKRFVEYYAREFTGVGSYSDTGNQQYYRQDDIWSAASSAALCHLGYELTKPVEEFLERGFDVVIHYFCDDWWKADKDSAEVMDKRFKRRPLHWFEPFSTGLFVGLLTQRWGELAKVCSWVEADLNHEYLGDQVEEELVHLYRSIAAGLRPDPMPKLTQVEEKIRKCRTLRPKLLFSAWEAARDGNQPAFEEAFLKALKHYRANFVVEREPPLYWIALHHSVVGMAAERLGMKLPELSEEFDAVLVTRKSLGLPVK